MTTEEFFQSKLQAEDGAGSQLFGDSVSISGSVEHL